MYKTQYRSEASLRGESEWEETKKPLDTDQSKSEREEKVEVDNREIRTLENSSYNYSERKNKRKERINSRKNSCEDPFFWQPENNVERLDYVNSDDPSAKSHDPFNAVQEEEISFPTEFHSLHKAGLRKRKGSVDQYLVRKPAVLGPGTADSEKGESIRRRSSTISLPYFYPDPYSVVVSRYSNYLGSISSHSSTAGGSETTEYLQLSESPLLSSSEDSYESNTAIEELRRSSGRLIVRSSISENGTLYDSMNFASALSTSEEYQSFTSSVPLKRICVEADGSKEWKVYDAGPRSIRTPLLCIGPACSTADVFYRQLLNLTSRGIRVMSVESPVYWTVEDWCKGLKKLLDCLNLDKVHIFGASLGGFLAQKFTEYTYNYSRVASLILCNTFLDTSIFDYNDSAMIFWMLPSVILKKLIIENITAAPIMDLDIAHAIEFMIERLNNLSQQELASRMTLNCVNCHVDTFKLKQVKMTIVDVFDESALSNQARDEIYRHYTDAKLAHLKSGGNFPYLSRSDEVNLHILVHLRSFNGTKLSAQLEENGNISSLPLQSTSALSAIRGTGSTVNKKPEDVLGSALPNPESFPSSCPEDDNQAFKEKAASVLGLPVT